MNITASGWGLALIILGILLGLLTCIACAALAAYQMLKRRRHDNSRYNSAHPDVHRRSAPPAEALGGKSPLVPVACPIGGDQESITVAHGHATSALTCNEPGQVRLADDLLSSRSRVRVAVGALRPRTVRRRVQSPSH